MQVFRSLDEIIRPFPGAVITIGNFDGVHIGHQALFHTVLEKAEASKGTALAMTFEPHPLKLFKKSEAPPLITMLPQKIELIEKTGIDALIVVPFTPEFAKTPARTFVSDILMSRLGVSTLVVGPDYSFGRGREGNVESLAKLSGELAFTLSVVPWIEALAPNGERISSTRIRDLVQKGLVEEARRLLGRDYQVRGTVIHGHNRGGRLLGFPTANLAPEDELIPAFGVYAVTVEIAGRMHQGVANVGKNPTFGDDAASIEAHILDFSGDLYGSPIKLNFVARLRGEKKFSGVEELKEQIAKDIRRARKLLPLA
ncbi:MAG: bifunctional riboflavin kinase/FAD synthetase [Thermodesulfobacteriota bacterium]